MKTVAYYHILMINNWKEIVAEQLSLIKESGLYDKLDSINIGCLGRGLPYLKGVLKDYPKGKVRYHSLDKDKYEFPTLGMLYVDSVDKPAFNGIYFHTKGVSYPKNNGGKYWRDFMNYYNITLWEDCIDKLKEGNDLCGVKLITQGWESHYSGNFFWFKSSYVRKINEVKYNKDRCQAEFWVCSGKNAKMGVLSDEFVDYNTKGEFIPPVNYVHTLAYNLVSETEKAVKSLYELNNKNSFVHVIVDLGFPLINDVIPKNIKQAQKNNSAKLKAMAKRYGSEYLKIKNVGVSQNWTAVYEYFCMNPDDILIGADPDERPQQKGWVKAMGVILRSKHKIGLAALTQPAQKKMVAIKKIEIGGVKAIIPANNTAWALIGMRGDFIDYMGGVPFPKEAKRYGWIEGEVMKFIDGKKWNWCMLPDYIVVHTDYEWGHKGTSKLLRLWKNLIIFNIKEYGQISFENFLERKRNGEFS